MAQWEFSRTRITEVDRDGTVGVFTDTHYADVSGSRTTLVVFQQHIVCIDAMNSK